MYTWSSWAFRSTFFHSYSVIKSREVFTRAASKFLMKLSLDQKWHFSISIHYFIRSICLKIPFQKKTQSLMCQKNPLKKMKFKYLKLKNVDLKLLTLKSYCLNILCLCSTCGLSCITAMVASGIQFEQCFFLRDKSWQWPWEMHFNKAPSQQSRPSTWAISKMDEMFCLKFYISQ